MKQSDGIIRIKNDTDYLSRENTSCLKGLLAVGILAHHLYQHSGILRGNPLGYLLQMMGYWVVGIFFFLSGYGLMVQYQRKGSKWIAGFAQKKIVPFYLQYLIFVFIYLIYGVFLGENEKTATILTSFVWGGTAVKNGWYLQTQLLVYIAFYCVFRLNKSESAKIKLMSMVIAVYFLFCNVAGMGKTWYITVPMVLLGILWCKKRQIIDELFEVPKIWIVMPLALVCAAAFWIVGTKAQIPSLLQAVFMTCAMVVLNFVVMAIVSCIRVDYSITRFLGKISLEIYVLQGIFLSLFHSEKCYIENPVIYILAVTICTLSCAWITSPIFNRFNLMIKGQG